MDWSKLPDSQRQELEQLQKQFQEHQAQQQKQHESVQQPLPPAYDPFQMHQPYDPSRAYDHSYYYNYHDPSQQQRHHQYDASYYQNYYSNSYHQQPYTTASATAPNEPQRNAESGSGYLGLGQGQVHDSYVNQLNLGGGQPNPGYAGAPGLNPTAAAAAVAALSQLTQFAGAMGAPVAGGGHYDPGHFRPPVFVREQVYKVSC
ncbi:hypothetical protein L1987_80924 [Smallanthus sonchifolius]|uniref:Uncharacterized protein n=1 Tax=Smallanthus sonchifolius TaxID=185202 RepID=A0ACB8YP10_9ASTR|nr:hypothetical protein L1987_80924 [Smallanthus sonchifolius]